MLKIIRKKKIENNPQSNHSACIFITVLNSALLISGRMEVEETQREVIKTIKGLAQHLNKEQPKHCDSPV